MSLATLNEGYSEFTLALPDEEAFALVYGSPELSDHSGHFADPNLQARWEWLGSSIVLAGLLDRTNGDSAQGVLQMVGFDYQTYGQGSTGYNLPGAGSVGGEAERAEMTTEAALVLGANIFRLGAPLQELGQAPNTAIRADWSKGEGDTGRGQRLTYTMRLPEAGEADARSGRTIQMVVSGHASSMKLVSNLAITTQAAGEVRQIELSYNLSRHEDGTSKLSMNGSGSRRAFQTHQPLEPETLSLITLTSELPAHLQAVRQPAVAG